MDYAVDGVAPPAEQVAAALAARKDRVQPSYRSGAVDGQTRWLVSTQQPFAMLLAQLLESFNLFEGGREFAPGGDEVESLHALAPEAVRYFEERQTGLLKELEDLVSLVQGVPLLATVTFLTRFKAWGSYYEPDEVPNAIDHEIFAAIVARQDPHSGRYPEPTDLLNAIRLVSEARNVAQTLNQAYQFANEQPSPDEMLRGLTIQRWLTVRGASVPQFAGALAREFANDYGKQFVNKLGFRYDDLEKLAKYIHQRWRGGLKAGNSACWDHASEMTGCHPDTPGEATTEWRFHYYKSLLLLIPALMSFPVSDLDKVLSDPAGRHSGRASAILRHLGIRVGEWDKTPGPLADTPIRTRPFLLWSRGDANAADSNSQALFINPGALDADMTSTMEALLAKEFPSNWSQKRAQVVDDYAVQLLSKHLPGASKASGIFIRELESNLEFEMDGLIIKDDIAIVVEGKGAPLKLASSRGDVRRLKSQFEGLIGEAWNQLQRDREVLFGSSSSKFQITRRGAGDPVVELSLRLAGVSKIYSVIPTLDGLGEAGSNLAMLYGLGIIPDRAAPWIVSVPDLGLVVETLRNISEFVAYLDFRETWSKHPQVRVHDEIEMLAMFLEGTDVAYRIGHFKEGENGIAFISGGQARFDDYYAYLRGDGPIAEQPRKKMTTRVRRIVDGLMRVKPNGWLNASTALLRTPMSTAIAIDTSWSDINKKLRANPWVIAGDALGSIMAARSNINWNDLLSDEQILRDLQSREIVWFARRDTRNKLRLEWASLGSEVEGIPRWDF
ncbi:hypothetical protein [Streptosporangium subroseum]|uniref:hypothetical protein n=1 Tax=Streptosporangium subroseum TaxID=106412 RepID=UPI00308BB64D|nr:hypothetical protein OHB15_47000 [Streptosporangium subroseum]